MIYLHLLTPTILHCILNGRVTVRTARTSGNIVSAVTHLPFEATLTVLVHKVAEVFGLRKYMRFRQEVIDATWDDRDGKWYVATKSSPEISGIGNQVTRYSCDIFLYATGVLNNIKLPAVKGLEKFKGRVGIV